MALGAFRGSWRQAALFFLLAGGLAGVVMALGLMAGSPLGLVQRVYYADVSWPLLLAASIGGYAALHLLFGQGQDTEGESYCRSRSLWPDEHKR